MILSEYVSVLFLFVLHFPGHVPSSARDILVSRTIRISTAGMQRGKRETVQDLTSQLEFLSPQDPESQTLRKKEKKKIS